MRARLRGNFRAVLFLFFPFVTRIRQWMYVVATARCLGKRCDCYGTGDWNEHADKFSLRTAFEGVSSQLEVQRQVDETSAAQCRKRELAETSHSSKSATCKEATARLQSAKSCSGDMCWCPQCSRYVVDKAFVQGHAVAHLDQNARAERRSDVPSVTRTAVLVSKFALVFFGIISSLECAWTETRAPGTWNRAAVEVETKRRRRDPGR